MMTPLHPIAAVAAGAVLGLAALTAPNSVPGHQLLTEPPVCGVDCTGSITALPEVGQSLSDDQMHMVTMPGRYGLSDPHDGDGYAIVAGQLVRIDIADSRILSVLRPAPKILD